MAEETKKKTVKKVKKSEEVVTDVESKKAPKAKVNDSWTKMSISELKLELQKLALDIKSGREKNTSLSKKLKKHIAKEMSKSNSK